MLIVIVGPTGSGKTSLAIKLADFYHAPIINADAFQIYDEMNIGTAKVEKNSEEYKKHYLFLPSRYQYPFLDRFEKHPH